MGTQWYQAYRRTAHWQRMRKRALELSEYHCRLCCAEKSLEVHHNTCERLWAERDADLIVLCHNCHTKYHDLLPAPPEDYCSPVDDLFFGIRNQMNVSDGDHPPGGYYEPARVPTRMEWPDIWYEAKQLPGAIGLARLAAYLDAEEIIPIWYVDEGFIDDERLGDEESRLPLLALTPDAFTQLRSDLQRFSLTLWDVFGAKVEIVPMRGATTGAN